MKKKKVIAVDIDGILTLETTGIPFSKRTPNLENIKYVNYLYNKQNLIYLYTSRYQRDRQITKSWLKFYKVKYHKLVLGKMKYDFLIDDKSGSSFPFTLF